MYRFTGIAKCISRNVAVRPPIRNQHNEVLLKNINRLKVEPLLYPSVCILLLLPLTTLSCSNAKPLKNITDDYMATIQTELMNARRINDDFLKNVVCAEIKHIPQCSMGNRSVVSSLFHIACRINNLPLDHTHQLTQSVQYSLKCPCSGRPCENQSTRQRLQEIYRAWILMMQTGRPNRRGRIARHERNEKKKQKKLCRVKTLLSSLTQCYQFLNSHE